MNPVAANSSAAAVLEGYRRAMSEYTPPAARPDGQFDLTQVIESATEHAQALAPRQPGTGERLDRTV